MIKLFAHKSFHFIKINKLGQFGSILPIQLSRSKNHSKQATEWTSSLGLKKTFFFSTSPDKIPQIFHLKKKLQSIKAEKGQVDLSYIELLHYLTVSLALQKFYTEAIQPAEKAVQLVDQFIKRNEKTPLSQSNRILFNRTLQGLYKQTDQISKNVEIAIKILQICTKDTENAKQLQSLVVEQYIELGQSYYTLEQFQKSMEAFQNAIKRAEKNVKSTDNILKIISAKNYVGDILLNRKHQTELSLTALKSSFSLIQKVYTEKFDMGLLSDCLLNMTQIYVNSIGTLSQTEISGYLESIKNFAKEICIFFLTKDQDIEKLLVFYRNLGSLYHYVKDFNRAIQCYRFQKQYLQKGDHKSNARCLQNQTLNYKCMNKIEKAIQKLTKAIELREKILEELKSKKRKSDQQLKELKQNKQALIGDYLQLSKLFKIIKNQNNTKHWLEKYNTLKIDE